MSHAQIFANSILNQMPRDGTLPKCYKVIFEGEGPVLICIVKRYSIAECGKVQGRDFCLCQSINSFRSSGFHDLDFNLVVV